MYEQCVRRIRILERELHIHLHVMRPLHGEILMYREHIMHARCSTSEYTDHTIMHKVRGRLHDISYPKIRNELSIWFHLRSTSYKFFECCSVVMLCPKLVR